MDVTVRTGLNWLVFCGWISVNTGMNIGRLHSVGNFLMSSEIGKALRMPLTAQCDRDANTAAIKRTNTTQLSHRESLDHTAFTWLCWQL